MRVGATGKCYTWEIFSLGLAQFSLEQNRVWNSTIHEEYQDVGMEVKSENSA
jgi:hypothetical protein